MEDFCRSCSRTGEFQRFDLSTISQISNVRIDDMLVDCTQQQVSVGDSLPQQVCAECFTALNSAFLFRKLTQHSEHGFRQIIDNAMSVEIHHQSQDTVDDDLLQGDTVPDIQMPLVTNESILPDVGIKEEEIHLEDPQIGTTIPVMFEEALEPIENPPEVDVIPRKKRGWGPTTFACKDCGYISQNCFNFKRHQKTQKHFAFSRLITRRPVNVVKHVLKQYIEPSLTKAPAKIPKQRKNDKNKAPRAARTRKPYKSTRTLYRCDDCGYQNYNSFNFRRHQATWKHTKTSTFQDSRLSSTVWSMLECRDCGIEFLSNNELKAHRRQSCLSRINEGPSSTNTSHTTSFSSVDDVLALWKLMEESNPKKRKKRKAAPAEETVTQEEPVEVKIELPNVDDEPQ